MNTFWANLGISEVDIPLMSDGEKYYNMLKTAPNLQDSETKPAIIELIRGLRSAELFDLAEDLVNKHKDSLPCQFVNEVKMTETEKT